MKKYRRCFSDNLMDSLKILKYNSQPNAHDKRVAWIKRDFQLRDDKFPDSKTDKDNVYENFRRKKYEYYKRKYENFPERDTPHEKSARKYNKWRTAQYKKIEKNQGLKKTKLCRSVIMGCECKFGARGKCNYAHSVEELVIPMCVFGQHCHCKRTCSFPHTEEERQKMQNKKRAYVNKLLESKQPINDVPIFEKHTKRSRINNIINRVATQTVIIIISKGFANVTAKSTFRSTANS